MHNYLLSLCLLLIATAATAQTSGIFPLGVKADNVHHTGDIWLYIPGDTTGNFDYHLAVATSAPGAKLDWHLHPAGQQLIITEGVGYYQERNQSVLLVRKGDIIKCTPGIEHWHGATPDEGVVYLAITGNTPTEWKEPVAQEEYDSIDTQSSVEAELLRLSRDKWQWMADQDADRLAELFHPQAKFVHMGGSWGKDREVEIIRSGGIHYKQATIRDESVEVIGNTGIVLSNIELLAVVGGNEVTNPFEVTEVYTKVDGDWKLASLSFTRLLER
jgi:quercetin dioxygenase-like cupin family protein